MDRNTEAKMQYEDALRMIERFQKREQLKVEGQWFLGEREGYPSFVCSAEWLTREISGYNIEDLESWGWIVTPVKIFREG